MREKIVLLVEDDENLRGILKMMCEKKGWTVHEAGDGKEAFEKTKASMPAVVLLDLLMPVLDGFGYLKLLRGFTDPDVANIPVIVLSNLYTNEDILKAESLKIQGYFVKTNTTLEEVIGTAEQIVKR